MSAAKIPGLNWRKRLNGERVAYWIAPTWALGYKFRTQRLWSGIGEPTNEEMQKLRIACMRLQRELKEWDVRPERRRPHKSYFVGGQIYFARAGDRVKIGFTGRSVRQRLSSIQSMTPVPVILIGSMKGNKNTEREIHARFDHLRHRGEWFFFSDEIEAFIAQNIDATPDSNGSQMLEQAT